MSFSPDDLTFRITPQTDQAAIERYLRAVEAGAADAGKKAGDSLVKGLAAVPPPSALQFDSSDLVRRSDLLKQVTEQLTAQHAQLSAIEALHGPQVQLPTTVPAEIGQTPPALPPQLPPAVQAQVTTSPTPPAAAPQLPPVTTVPVATAPTPPAAAPTASTAQPATVGQQRLAVERQIAEAVEHQRRLQHQMTEAGVSPELVHRKQLLEQITAELAKQHQQAVEVEQSHQFPKKGQQPAAPEVAEAATKQRLELEQRIADAQREQADVEQRVQVLLDNSPLEVRKRAMEAVNAQLDTERQKLAQINALSDPKHVQERLAVEKQIAEVRRQQAEAVPKEPPATALDAKAETLKQITEQIKEQSQELERQQLMLDPAVVAERKRLAAIQQQVQATKERADAAVEQKEGEGKGFDVKEVLEAFKEGGLVAGLKTALSSAFKGVDIPKLVAGALGGFIGGGTKAAAGAVAGGVVGAKTEAPVVSQTPAAVPPTVRVVEAPAERQERRIPQAPREVFRQEQRPQQQQPQLPQANLQVPRTAEAPAPKPAQVPRTAEAPPPTPAQVPRGGVSQAGAPPSVPATKPTAAPATPGAELSGQAVGEVAGAGAAGGAEGAAGAAAGLGVEALAGPIGIAVLAVQATAKVVGQVAALPFKAINGGLELVKNGLDDMQGPLGPIGAGIGVASKGLHTFADAVSSIPLLGDALGPMLQAAAAVPDALKGITESLVRMSRLASPAQAKQLDMAVEDSQAVVGRSFLPLLAMITDGVRLAGDALASFLPNDREMTAALKETRAALAPLAAQIREALSTVGPIVRQKFAEVVQWIGKHVQVAVQFIEQLEPALSELWQIARQVDEAVSPLREQLSKLGFFALSNVLRGVAITVSAAVRALDMLLEPLRMIGVLSRQVQAPTGEGGRSSRNAAAREASFESIEQYQQQLQQGAYGQAADPQTQMVTQQQATNNYLERIFDLLNRGISVTILRNLGQAASEPPRLAAGALGRGVGALAGLLGVGGG